MNKRLNNLITSRIVYSIILLALLVCICPFSLRAQECTHEGEVGRPVIGIGSNLLYDVTCIPGYGLTSIPSFSLEFYPARGKYTFGVDAEWPMWKHREEHRYMQINNVTLWARRYFKPAQDSVKGPYLLANVNAARYGIGWQERGWEGEGLGASLGAGWKWCFGRFFVDTGIAIGYFYSRYDPYIWGNDSTGWYYYDYSGNPADFVPRNISLSWFGPTRAYISVGIDLFTRKRK